MHRRPFAAWVPDVTPPHAHGEHMESGAIVPMSAQTPSGAALQSDWRRHSPVVGMHVRRSMVPTPVGRQISVGPQSALAEHSSTAQMLCGSMKAPPHDVCRVHVPPLLHVPQHSSAEGWPFWQACAAGGG
jgi:hypothetical protein